MSQRMLVIGFAFTAMLLPFSPAPAADLQRLPAHETGTDEAEWEARLDQKIGSLDILQRTQIETALNGILSVFSGFKFVIDEGVRGTVELRLADKTLREILDSLLTPNGFVWTRKGNTIFVTPKFRTRVFPLTSDEFVKARRVLEHPESLENPELDIQRLIYGERHPQTIPGREIRLNNKAQTLIVRDTEENIAKTEAWLRQLEKAVIEREPLIYRSYKLDCEIAETLYELVRRFLIEERAGSEEVFQKEGRRIIYDEENCILVVHESKESIEHVEEIIRREDVIGTLKESQLKARVFRITDDVARDPGSTANRLRMTRAVVRELESLLYGPTREDIEGLQMRGRRIFYPETPEEEQKDPRFIGTITVVNTEENLGRVAEYLANRRTRITVDALLLEVPLAALEDLGISLDAAGIPELSHRTTLESLSGHHQANMQAAPTVSTLNGRNASVEAKDGIVHYLEHTEDGICRLEVRNQWPCAEFVFSVTPALDGNAVMLDLLFASADRAADGSPEHSARNELRTRVRIPDGETAVLAFAAREGEGDDSATIFALRPRIPGPSKDTTDKPNEDDSYWQARLDERIGDLEIPKPTVIETVLEDILSVLSGFTFEVDDDVEGMVEARITHKTLREILDLLLEPRGFAWTREGDTILVRTDFRSRVFPLTPEEYKKVEQILEDPESLENPELDLRRIIYDEQNPETVPGRELRLDYRTQTLIVQDGQRSIEKVEAWLAQLDQIIIVREPYIQRSWVIDPKIAPVIHEKAYEYLVNEVGGGKKAYRAAGKKILFYEDRGGLVIKDTKKNIEHVEELIRREMPPCEGGLRPGALKARVFRVTEDTGTDPESTHRRLEVIRGVVQILKGMLYEGTGEGEAAAAARGRRIFYPKTAEDERKDPRFIGTITVVDTDENLRKVKQFLGGPPDPETSEVRLPQAPDIVTGYPDGLVYWSITLDREIAADGYELARRYLVEEMGGGEEVYGKTEKKVLLDRQTGNLTVLDRHENIEELKAILLRDPHTVSDPRQPLKARVFHITENKNTDPDSVAERLQLIGEVVDELRILLYEGSEEIEREANAKRQRIFFPEDEEQEQRDPRFIGTITVVDLAENLDRIDRYLAKRDTRISIEARILIFPSSLLDDLRISGDWSLISPTRLAEFLNSVSTDDNAEVLSSPKITARDGQNASVSTPVEGWAVSPGSLDILKIEWPPLHYLEPVSEGQYRVATVDQDKLPAIVLSATPTIIGESILLDLEIQIRQIAARRPLPDAPDLLAGEPIFRTRSISTRLKMKNRETAVASLLNQKDSHGNELTTIMTITVDVIPGKRLTRAPTSAGVFRPGTSAGHDSR